jgi:hypothetical protein
LTSFKAAKTAAPLMQTSVPPRCTHARSVFTPAAPSALR